MEQKGEYFMNLCLQWIDKGLDALKQLPDLTVVWYHGLTDLAAISKGQHCILVTVFLLVVFIISCVYSKRHTKATSSVKNRNESPIKLNWNVFDLAKTAYEEGHTEAVIRLVEKYAYDVNYVMPSSGLSLFLCSCLSGDGKLIRYMLSKGADLQIRTREGDSPIYLATFGILNSPNVSLDVLKDLVNAGSCVNTQNLNGYTPLHRAAARGNKDVIRCLLKLGADLYLHTKVGIYPMDSAINAGHLDAAELLKIKLDNPHVWEVVDPHTPPRIKLGLQSPIRKHLIESIHPRRPFHNVMTF